MDLIALFFYTVFGLLTVVALACFALGLKNPETFRFLFKEKTSKLVVGWSFGGLVLLFATIASNLEPKSEVSSSPTPLMPAPAQKNEVKDDGKVVAAEKTRAVEVEARAGQKTGHQGAARLPRNIPDLYMCDPRIVLPTTRLHNLKGKVHTVIEGKRKDGQDVLERSKTYTRSGMLSERRTFDSDGNVKRVDNELDEGHNIVPHSTDQYKDGKLFRRIFSNGQAQSLSYNLNGYLSEVITPFGGDVPTQTWTYVYGPTGEVTQMTQQFSGGDETHNGQNVSTYNKHGDESQFLTYDKQGKLKSGIDKTYTYDSRGNWVQRVNGQPKEVDYGGAEDIPTVYYRVIKYYD